MRFPVPPKWSFFLHKHKQHTPLRYLLTNQQRRHASTGGGGGGVGKGLWVPGATVATLLMLGALHTRRLYNDSKLEEARQKGIEPEFKPDTKATFLRMLPLRAISRMWGSVTSVDLPLWFRPYVYKAWARAFHSNLEEAALPLDQYASLRDFFIRTLKEGSRPIDLNPYSLASPVDGTIMRFGELKESDAMIEQVKGFSYSASSLLGASSYLPLVKEDMLREHVDEEKIEKDTSKKSWWRISVASPKARDPTPVRSMKGVFYCVIYLTLGDYHRIHSPIDWNVFVLRHFSGRLFPVNERAARTIRNLYVENERVVLEGQWAEGFMALAAVGATNIGSIKLLIEPELRTNKPKKKLLPLDRPEERIYEPGGVTLKKGEEVAAFNMGSTVVLVFQAPVSNSPEKDGSNFKFCVKRGDRIRMGETLGKWRDT